ncbi:RNA polymerase subunit AC19 [Orbilia oligospora]|uniref:DNA-directed RNA polymerases I and III subunit RPAC2 n=1 Tax=Orbilia oligospora TaxID=2813651 RepID=A0A6G1M8Q0_ORBOL|nr:RNA polymerase subunit AC19 [Orbilia oligospora]KAF3216149.1 RNA polymerase subunit AC19 [Orbilia oligospora]KAF3223970.1 RNA polymerase subunit AC19 [Orbilia oligospora]KAF3229309.1 RNA polymerase subunit AC19 [Orbilia oligospora]KAF3248818.1 RNA polymerase subunit AC19 [Orbilia oligospora]
MADHDESLPDAPEYATSNIAGSEASDDDEPLDLTHENNAKIIMLGTATDDDSCASFQFENEDHTLGNALRWIIMKNPQVEFCGYSIPHPSETKMNMRIQTYGEITAKDALIKGLADLRDLCDVVTDKFIAEKERFMAEKGN